MMTTTAFSAAAETSPVSYAFTETSLGLAAVAAGSNGVHAILFGESREALRRDLAERLPEIALAEDAEALREAVAAVATLVDDPGRQLELVLAPGGSDFERAVWDALRAVPAGETVSYGEIAARIGAAGQAYAVGAACAANPIAIAIPCHRVVKKDGGIAGYRWGVRRKRALLARERRQREAA